MTISIQNAQLTTLEASGFITRGQSRIFFFTPKYTSIRELAAGTPSPDYVYFLNQDPYNVDYTWDSNTRKTISLNYEWQKLEWICINPGGTILPTSPSNATCTLRKNTSPVGLPKNGANTGDFIVPLLVKSSVIDLNSAFHFANSNFYSTRFQCTSDKELLYITVKDKNAVPVKDYEIIIDNTYYGKTDASGIFITSLENASTDTKHMINGCKCFTTTGACNQQKIDIVLKDVVKPVCTNLTIDCL